MYTQKEVYQLDVTTASGLALQTVADKLFWSPGISKVLIRGIAAIVTTAITGGDQAIVAWEKRITAGSDTGRVTTGVPTLTIPGGTAVGKVIYKVDQNFVVSPGEEIVLKLTDATAAGAAHILMEVETLWENPANNTNMTASA